MAEAKQRWSVTYTKHVKQKRKVDQDGFLEHHTSTNKMLLFDDCEKLLECRILKKDEAVSSGETLTFNAFLVDVNDAVSGGGGHQPVPAFNSQAADVKFTEKRAKSWKKPRAFLSPSQSNMRGNKPQTNLSPSQNLIKEFRKKELHKYGAALSSPETTKTSTTEWQALYTTQLTQKAKKYHDGFLQLAIIGSHGKQIRLLDASRNQLDSRFLKKDEVVISGESIAFDTHLVDIGNKEGDHRPVTDLNSEENKHSIVREARAKQGQHNGAITSKDNGEEWKVLYTTQVTQKAKKYHDGFLKISTSGSIGRQAMLFDVARKVLDTRFLKKDEVIRSGDSFAFNAHLVDIGEPEGNHEALVDIKFQRKDDCIIIDDFETKEWEALYTTQITQKSKKYHAGILRLSSAGSYRKKATLLGEDKTILSSKYINLSDDIKTGSTFELPKYLVEVGIPRESAGGEETTHNKACMEKASDSSFIFSSVKETKPSRGAPIDKPSGKITFFPEDEEKPHSKDCLVKALNSNFGIVEKAKRSTAIPANKLIRDAHQILSFLQKPVAQESIVSGHVDSNTARTVSSTKVSQFSEAVMLDFSADGQRSKSQSKEPYHRSVDNILPIRNMDIGDSPDLLSFKAISSGCDKQLAESIIRNSHKLYSGYIEPDARQHERVCASDESSVSCVSDNADEDEQIVSEEPICAREIEVPSFDLGF